MLCVADPRPQPKPRVVAGKQLREAFGKVVKRPVKLFVAAADPSPQVNVSS
jgi:hypothetical protein